MKPFQNLALKKISHRDFGIGMHLFFFFQQDLHTNRRNQCPFKKLDSKNFKRCLIFYGGLQNIKALGFRFVSRRKLLEKVNWLWLCRDRKAALDAQFFTVETVVGGRRC